MVDWYRCTGSTNADSEWADGFVTEDVLAATARIAAFDYARDQAKHGFIGRIWVAVDGVPLPFVFDCDMEPRAREVAVPGKGQEPAR